MKYRRNTPLQRSSAKQAPFFSPKGEESATFFNQLPNPLRTGVENLSGMAMDDVQVHYNSSEPAEVQAYAFARGNEIHLGPGQEKHLPHEAWHVVQQKQGRVQPNLQMKGAAINTDAALESEADQMGTRALQHTPGEGAKTAFSAANSPSGNAIQRKLSLQGTAWNQIKHAWFLKAKKVFALSDKSKKDPQLVVKSEEVPYEVVLATNILNMEGQLRNTYGIAAPQTRVLNASEAHDIENGIIGRFGDPQAESDAQDILKHRSPMVFDFASGQNMDSAIRNEKHSEKKGFFGNEREARSSSPLLRFGEPHFAFSLGRIAGVDILLGNKDRIVGKFNPANLMLDKKTGNIGLIDNIEGDYISRLVGDSASQTPVTPQSALDDWKKDQIMKDFAAGSFNKMAADAWDLLANEIAMSADPNLVDDPFRTEDRQVITKQILPAIKQPFLDNFAEGLKFSKQGLLVLIESPAYHKQMLEGIPPEKRQEMINSLKARAAFLKG